MTKLPRNTIKSLTDAEMALLEQSITFDKIKDHIDEDTQDELEYLQNRPLNANDVAELFIRLNERYAGYTTTLMRQVSILNYAIQREISKDKLEEYIKEHDELSQESSEEENKKREEMEELFYKKIEDIYTTSKDE